MKISIRVYILLVSLVCVSACTPARPIAATPTMVTRPQFDLAPTPMTGENFDCWSAPALHPKPATGAGNLLIALESNGVSKLYLYSFVSQTYALLASNSWVHYGTFEPVSPDKSAFWYGVNDNSSDTWAIYLFNLGEMRSRKLFDIEQHRVEEYNPMGLTPPLGWSNDGECLFFGETHTNSNVIAYRVRDRLMQRQPLIFSNDRFLYSSGVRISYDGQYRAFSCDEVYNPNFKGKEHYRSRVCILSTRGKAIHYKDGEQSFKAWANPIKWSPTENILAFQYVEDVSTTFPYETVRLVFLPDAKAGTYQNIYSGSEVYDSNLEWSPDGKKLLFFNQKIYDLASGKTNDLTALAGISGTRIRWATWSPDGSKIAFAGQNDGLAVFDLATGAVEKLPDMPEQNPVVRTFYWVTGP